MIFGKVRFKIYWCCSWFILFRHFLIIIRSSRSQIFFKNDVLKHFANFTRKHLRWSLFLIKLQVFRPATLLKSDSNYFPENTFFIEHLWQLLLKFSDGIHIMKVSLTLAHKWIPLLVITYYLKTSLPTSLLISKVQEHLIVYIL